MISVLLWAGVVGFCGLDVMPNATQPCVTSAEGRLMQCSYFVDDTFIVTRCLLLQLEDGFVQYRFDCGSGPGSVRVDSAAVNDGYWHKVAVERISKNVRIIVDDMYTAEGSGPGTNDVLNLDSNDVFFGAQVDVSARGLEQVGRGFIGCLQKVRIDLVDLPLHGSSSVGVLQNMHDIEFHCQGIYIPGEILDISL